MIKSCFYPDPTLAIPRPKNSILRLSSSSLRPEAHKWDLTSLLKISSFFFHSKDLNLQLPPWVSQALASIMKIINCYSWHPENHRCLLLFSQNGNGRHFATLVRHHKWCVSSNETLMIREASIRSDFHMKALNLFNPTPISTGLPHGNNIHALLKQGTSPECVSAVNSTQWC